MLIDLQHYQQWRNSPRDVKGIVTWYGIVSQYVCIIHEWLCKAADNQTVRKNKLLEKITKVRTIHPLGRMNVIFGIYCVFSESKLTTAAVLCEKQATNSKGLPFEWVFQTHTFKFDS